MGDRRFLVSVAALWVSGTAIFGAQACSGRIETPTSPLLSVTDAARESEAAPRNDDAAPEATADATDANTCAPGDVSTYLPKWRPPKPFGAGKCTPSEVQQYFADCMSSGSRSVADAYRQAHAECTKCIESADDDATRGVLVWYSDYGYYYLNEGGCIAATQHDLSPTGCGAAWQALDECDIAACGPSCPADASQGSYAAFAACAPMAEKSVCAKIAATYTDACASLQDPDASADVTSCTGAGLSRKKFFLQMATRFCGDAPDAGDAGDAGDAADASDADAGD